jgi:hypothetical protein
MHGVDAEGEVVGASEAQTQGGVGVLLQAGAVSARHGGLRECTIIGGEFANSDTP